MDITLPVLFHFVQVLLNLNKISAEINFRISDVCWSGGGCAKFFESATLRDLWAKKDLGVQKLGMRRADGPLLPWITIADRNAGKFKTRS
jgi:hypothetical protein